MAFIGFLPVQAAWANRPPLDVFHEIAAQKPALKNRNSTRLFLLTKHLAIMTSDEVAGADGAVDGHGIH